VNGSGVRCHAFTGCPGSPRAFTHHVPTPPATLQPESGGRQLTARAWEKKRAGPVPGRQGPTGTVPEAAKPTRGRPGVFRAAGGPAPHEPYDVHHGRVPAGARRTPPRPAARLPRARTAHRRARTHVARRPAPTRPADPTSRPPPQAQPRVPADATSRPRGPRAPRPPGPRAPHHANHPSRRVTITMRQHHLTGSRRSLDYRQSHTVGSSTTRAGQPVCPPLLGRALPLLLRAQRGAAPP
jgi:hypothetical protein